MSEDFALRSSRVVTPGGERSGIIIVRGGRIEAVVDSEPNGLEIRDVGRLAILPGVVDAHVHVNEPGRTEWEGFETATRAAAAGGITTIVDMPLNSIPVTTTVAALEIKRAAARGRVHVDCAFWGGVVPGNAGDLAALAAAGVRGAKAFLVHSGIEEFPASDRATLRAGMIALRTADLPLLAHAELLGACCATPSAAPEYAQYLASRPRAWENDAIRMLVALCRETGCRTHIVHLSSSDALPIVASARAEGLPLTVETCPHYLTFAAESIPSRSPAFKCAPPIREGENRERLWQGLQDGVIDMVVSDHSPSTPDLKVRQGGDFMAAWGGIASVQFSLAAVWTGAYARGFRLSEVCRWMSERSARLAGLAERKGAIRPGLDADLVVFDPEASFTIRADAVLHRHPLTPYLGMALRGVVLETYVRGRKVYDHGTFADPHGDLL
ncbi:MAG: allantoinase AllB [Vicinamibacteria bacterium]|nr:allantoinase AllB [Vicinamibacteria bacterium]